MKKRTTREYERGGGKDRGEGREVGGQARGAQVGGAVMTFAKWLKKRPRGTAVRLSREHAISASTVYRLQRGGTLRDYALAQRVSAATGGEVTAVELCEGQKGRKR